MQRHPCTRLGPARRRARSFLLAIGVLLVAGGSVARAGFSVTMFVDGGQLPTIFDNVFPDMNPAPNDMTIPFTVGDIGNNWTASGVIYANGGGGYPPVSTVVTDTLIEKLTPGLHFGEIRVLHDYAASGVFTHSAHLDGQFENVLNNPIGGAELNFIADVSGQNLGVFHDGPISGVNVHPFAADLGPLVLPTTTQHALTFQFYLDEPGDAIRLFNSAEIHTGPEPSTMLLAAIALLGARWRACRPGRRLHR
jgi:hypothetical protein